MGMLADFNTFCEEGMMFQSEAARGEILSCDGEKTVLGTEA
jgi:hypothetical protein